MNEATVIAYPVDSPNNRSHSNNSHLSHNSLMEENIYASSLGDSKFADDTIEMSGNFFSQVSHPFTHFSLHYLTLPTSHFIIIIHRSLTL